MKDTARLIIPVWGERYLSKVLSITLPAILAPGNLPALCESFEVELVIVTESRLFGTVKAADAFQRAAKVCATQLIPLDDLLTDVPDDYGMVLTYALFRGFADLGARVTDTYLLLFNADFIISDGSLRHLAKLMLEGHRVIHAPSFRVVLEDVWPQLQERVDATSGSLRMTSRDLVKLALANKHPTVKVRTVNQRLRHQYWMDQYYWYVDEDTIIGYQSPVALIAVKPERVVAEPTSFWDYGFIPEAAPTATPVFVTDSDDFFMIEPQSRETGGEMIRVGWFSLDVMAQRESERSTEQHRKAVRQLLKIHAADLPADLAPFVSESRTYMEEFQRRMSGSASHISHPLLGRWFDEAKARRRGAQSAGSQVRRGNQTSGPAISPQEPRRNSGILRVLFGGLRTIYRSTFGEPPQVGRCHPLWVDLLPICRRIAILDKAGQSNILWVGSTPSPLDRLTVGGRIAPAMLVASEQRKALQENGPYDACICELTIEELLKLDSLYAAIRPLVRDGGQIVVYVFKRRNLFDSVDLLLTRMEFPDVDISEIHFFGTRATTFLRLAHLKASQSFPNHPVARALTVSATLILLAPAVWLANARAARRDTAIFSPVWTSLMIDFTVKRGHRLDRRQPASQYRAEREFPTRDRLDSSI
jgi:hypothetical protein